MAGTCKEGTPDRGFVTRLGTSDKARCNIGFAAGGPPAPGYVLCACCKTGVSPPCHDTSHHHNIEQERSRAHVHVSGKGSHSSSGNNVPRLTIWTSDFFHCGNDQGGEGKRMGRKTDGDTSSARATKHPEAPKNLAIRGSGGTLNHQNSQTWTLQRVQAYPPHSSGARAGRTRGVHVRTAASSRRRPTKISCFPKFEITTNTPYQYYHKCLARSPRAKRPVHVVSAQPLVPSVVTMKAKTLQIAWHPDEDNQNFPILTVDIHPKYNIVATGSADKEIKVRTTLPCPSEVQSPPTRLRLQLWRLQESKDESTSWQCLFICSLSTHQQTVNSVRFSPDGSTLASVSDGASQRKASFLCPTCTFAYCAPYVAVHSRSFLLTAVLWCPADKTAILWRPVERKNTWDRVRDPRHVQKQMLVYATLCCIALWCDVFCCVACWVYPILQCPSFITRLPLLQWALRRHLLAHMGA